ncbi:MULTISPECIES: winged helix-turn-helix transcriptional regulator [Streptomyces]|uniref:winged helix-turn-helix transcriptional regulator n=1 Tax=Streptomyces TaxID=1883 RepID=UPI00163C62DC|nr:MULTISPECIES: helix-turn-helix domain-containing protein [Streptomyces]MBC2874333.1 helix-turn-helix transcriptional regulator [Streptomyces sp. TYQ1024]UBI40366.1 helix-turn-helix transcriptional regulator [Streptomyces mobaraensis]UKW32948.1 helix-turn-helix transcriptional regulator [Streptomyces sp. TYQ1024]
MRKRTFTCGFDAALAVVGGKWKILILWALHCGGPLRFGALRRAVDGISERVLINQLKEMEASQLVHREEFPQVPPKVEYSLTPFGTSLLDVLMPLGEWGTANMERIASLGTGGPEAGGREEGPRPASPAPR